MEQNLWVVAAALDSDFLRLTDLVAWADQQVLELDSPPNWLLDLCLAKNKNEAIGILLMKWNRYMETVGDEWPEPASHDDLYLGFLDLRFERGDVTMAQLLELAGQYSDAHECSIACETYYYMLNEIDGGGPTIPSNVPLGERVASLFAPMAALARQHLGNLPGMILRAP